MTHFLIDTCIWNVYCHLIGNFQGARIMEFEYVFSYVPQKYIL